MSLSKVSNAPLKKKATMTSDALDGMTNAGGNLLGGISSGAGMLGGGLSAVGGALNPMQMLGSKKKKLKDTR